MNVVTEYNNDCSQDASEFHMILNCLLSGSALSWWGQEVDEEQMSGGLAARADTWDGLTYESLVKWLS